MTALIRPRRFGGVVRVPSSKSHTIRRLIIASLAAGVSVIEHPLDSLDTRSCVSVCRALGAEISVRNEHWTVRGIPRAGTAVQADAAGNKAGTPRGDFSAAVNRAEPVRCDVGNSGTTFFLALAAASLGTQPAEFDGDEQIRSRSAAPLLDALAGLGVSVRSAPNGRAPVTVRGPWKGGRVSLSCPTSQYLSALLLAAPLAPAGVITEIDVPLLNEKPYIEMTLSYLDSGGPAYQAAPDYSYFRVPGGGVWKPIAGPVPADFSSAAFPAAAAVISGGSVALLGLDPDDTQGDKAFFGFLKKMGCEVKWEKVPAAGHQSGAYYTSAFEDKGRLQEPAVIQPALIQPAAIRPAEWRLTVSRNGPLSAGEFDLNDTPDLLPALAAVACFARGDTALVNVANARIKETDRIAVMAEELGKLGVGTTELADGLVIHGAGGIPQNSGGESRRSNAAGGSSKTSGAFKTDGRFDHRVVMALACAALGAPAPVEIAGAESASVTYPGFLELLGADSL